MVLVAVWGAKKAECQRATNSDTEIKQHPSGLLVLIGQGLKALAGREKYRHQESLVTLGKKKEGRHYRSKKKVEAERMQRPSYVPYLDNIRNLNSSAGYVLCAISQATEDRPGEYSLPNGNKDGKKKRKPANIRV